MIRSITAVAAVLVAGGILTAVAMSAATRPDGDVSPRGATRPAVASGVSATQRAGVMAMGTTRPGEAKVALVFSGGHEIGKGDFGRPVVLMGPALGVTPEEFREAFSGVTPARGGPPTREEQERNKAALMKVLSPRGVTNERMDEVANHYRFQPQNGELWPTTPAKGYAVVEGGKVKQIVVTDGGAGYSSPPEVRLAGVAGVTLKATLSFSQDFKKNGAVAAVTVAP